MHRSVSLFALALLACDPQKGGEEVDGPHCEDVATVVALDEVTALGFSAADLLSNIPSSESAILHYVDGATTDLTLGWTTGSEARFVDSEAVYPDDGETMTAIGVVCDDRVEVDGELAFGTADGAFAEVFVGAVSGTEPTPSMGIQLALDGLTGTFDVVPYVESTDYKEVSAWISLSWDAGVSSGTISGQASGGEECAEGETCTAWAENVDVASWGPDFE